MLPNKHGGMVTPTSAPWGKNHAALGQARSEISYFSGFTRFGLLSDRRGTSRRNATGPRQAALQARTRCRGSTPRRPRPSPARLPVVAVRVLLRRRSEEHTSELQSRENLVCRLLLEK